MSIEIDIQQERAGPTSSRRIDESVALHSSQRTGTWWKRSLVAVLVLGGAAASAAVLFRNLAPENEIKVLTHTITRGDLVVSVTEQGTLESSSNKEIKCKVKGTSTVLWVIETGTEVEPGDVLVRLDTSTIEDNISQQKIAYENALANKTTALSDVTVAEISITEYMDGTYQSELATKEKELVVAQSDLKTAQNTLDYARRMFRKGYISELELDSNEDAVKHAELEVKVKRTDLDVLQKFTRAKTLQELESVLDVARAHLGAYSAALELEQARLVREQEQLENCTIVADVAGMVIYPSAAEWKEQPDIEEGATVREDQVLLIIPDLKQMQVKIGVHESKVDRLTLGMKARVELQDGFADGTIESVASITKPTGWWNGNVVKYDTVIKLDNQQSGLKPGMSVAVEVFLAHHKDVLTIPVAAVVQQGRQFLCWVETDEGVVKRPLKLGDSNEQFIVAESGVNEGDRVVLNPLDFVDEAQSDALRPVEKNELQGPAKDAKSAGNDKPAGNASAGKDGSAKRVKPVNDGGKSDRGSSGKGDAGKANSKPDKAPSTPDGDSKKSGAAA